MSESEHRLFFTSMFPCKGCSEREIDALSGMCIKCGEWNPQAMLREHLKMQICVVSEDDECEGEA